MKEPEKKTSRFTYVDNRKPFQMECPGRTDADLPRQTVWIIPIYTETTHFSPDTQAIREDDRYKSTPLSKPDWTGTRHAHPINAGWKCTISNQEGPDCYSCMQRGGYLQPPISEKIRKAIDATKKQHS